MSEKLNLKPNIANADDFYADLLAAHEGLSSEETIAYIARLLLILSNHIGDRELLTEALNAAKAKA